MVLTWGGKGVLFREASSVQEYPYREGFHFVHTHTFFISCRQCLTMSPSQHRVVLCTHFSQLLHHSSPPHHPHHPHHPPTITSSHGHGICETGLCQIRSPHKSPTSHIPTLTKSPTQVNVCTCGVCVCVIRSCVVQFGVVPKRLFPAPQDPSHPPTEHTSHTLTLTVDTNTTKNQSKSDISSDDYHRSPHTAERVHPGMSTTTASGSRVRATSLLDAMEGSVRGLLSLHCRVLRVYRRTLPCPTPLTL